MYFCICVPVYHCADVLVYPCIGIPGYLTSPNVDDQVSTRVMFVRVQPNAGTRAVHLHRGKLEVRSAAFMDSVTESDECGGDRRRSRRKCMRRRHVLPAASTTSCKRKAYTNDDNYGVRRRMAGTDPRRIIGVPVTMASWGDRERKATVRVSTTLPHPVEQAIRSSTCK